jgi:hypothetical protein
MRSKRLFGTSDPNELSRLLTRERLKKTGVAGAASSVSDDPDLEALRKAVRSSMAGPSAARVGVSGRILRKLAGV